MKKIYMIALLFLLNSTINNAQTNLTTAVDFTVTDVDGNTHNLFNILNSGKYVCLDFFFTTCVPCQQTVPYYKQTYTNYGCNTQDVFFISIDWGNNDAQVIAYENTYLGGNAGFPAASGTQGGGNAVCTAYGVTAYPTYVLIAPNRAILEQDMYPIFNSGSFDTYFNAHSLVQKACLSTGVEEVNNTTISIYPNPAYSNLTIASINNEKISAVKMYNYLGELVMNEAVNNTAPYTVGVETLKPGMYFVEITTENKSVVIKKFIKQ